MSPVLPSAALEHALTAIESRLDALGAALRDRDALAIDSSAVELQRALAAAVQRLKHSTHPLSGASPELRHRLAAASAQVGAYRESLARASAALERAVQVLMPASNPAPAYAAQGGLDHLARGDYVGA